MQAAKHQWIKCLGFFTLGGDILAITWHQHAQAAATKDCKAPQCIEVGASTAVKDKNGTVQYYATCVVYAGNPFNPYLAEGWSAQTAHDNFRGTDAKGINTKAEAKQTPM